MNPFSSTRGVIAQLMQVLAVSLTVGYDQEKNMPKLTKILVLDMLLSSKKHKSCIDNLSPTQRGRPD